MNNNLHIHIADNKYFNKIFKYIEMEFPKEERKSLSHYNKLLDTTPYELILLTKKHSQNTASISNNRCTYNNENTIGYGLMYPLYQNNILWFDYLAILDEYKNMGYGSYFFNALKNFYNTQHSPHKFYGMLFEVEIPSGDINQTRRISFYENLGAIRILDNYILPSPSGGIPMYLYYMPFKAHTLSTKVIKQIILKVHQSIHHDISNWKSCYNNFCNSISDIHL